MKQAADSNDHKALFALMTREPQDRMLSGMLIASAITVAPIGAKKAAGKKERLEGILQKHGLDNQPPVKATGSPEQVLQQMSKKLEAVQDRAQLFEDLMRYLDEAEIAVYRHRAVSLEQLEKNGDEASATLVVKSKQTGATKTQRVRLTKIDGGWFFSELDWS